MGDPDHLVDAANTMYPAVLALRALGFVVTRTESDAGEVWKGMRDDLVVTADDPVRLLGLATLWRDRGPNWRASDEELEDLMREYLPAPRDKLLSRQAPTDET